VVFPLIPKLWLGNSLTEAGASAQWIFSKKIVFFDLCQEKGAPEGVNKQN
jgi:hypothetical protein